MVLYHDIIPILQDIEVDNVIEIHELLMLELHLSHDLAYPVLDLVLLGEQLYLRLLQVLSEYPVSCLQFRLTLLSPLFALLRMRRGMVLAVVSLHLFEHPLIVLYLLSLVLHLRLEVPFVDLVVLIKGGENVHEKLVSVGNCVFTVEVGTAALLVLDLSQAQHAVHLLLCALRLAYLVAHAARQTRVLGSIVPAHTSV